MSTLFERLKWIHQKFRLSYSLPFVILISYTLIGAAIFRKLELERDQNERSTFRNSYKYAFDQVLQRMLEIRCYDTVIRIDKQLQMHHTREAIQWFMDYLNLTSVLQERNDPSPWSWYGSMFYAGQLYTTIGYGLPVAKTRAGQIASIFYIMLGIPIFLIILKEVGRLLSRALRKFYKRLRTARNKLPSKRLASLSMPVKALYTSAYSLANSLGPDHKKLASMDVELGANEQNELNKKLSRENSFPIPIALSMLVLWIGVSAGLFCLWETEWGYLTSVYFFFVSISTVGLGDIVPGNKDMMLVNFVLILIGLALLSMCINLIQGAIEKFIDQLLVQYIEEIERVAAIVQGGGGSARTESSCATDYKDETTLEIGLTADLMGIPFVKPQRSKWTIPRTVKDWLAEKIANNLISSRIKTNDSDEDSEEDDHVSHLSALCQSKVSLTKPRIPVHKPKNLPTLKAVQAIEKARLSATDDDFQKMLFSKFVTNSRLEKLMGQICEEQRVTASKAVQTEPISRPLLAQPELELAFLDGRRLSAATTNTTVGQTFTSTSTFDLCDGDSMISNAYYDVRFDENYAAPHRDVERISHLLQKSQSSLEGAFRPDARSVFYYDTLLVPNERNVYFNDDARVLSRKLLECHSDGCYSTLRVPSFESLRSHLIPSTKFKSFSSSCCHLPSPYRSTNLLVATNSRNRCSTRFHDPFTLDRLRYRIGLLPKDFELPHFVSVTDLSKQLTESQHQQNNNIPIIQVETPSDAVLINFDSKCDVNNTNNN